MKQTQDKARNLTMMMDEYELTMANAYFNDPTIDNNTRVSFDVFYRVNPDGGGFAIFAGLQQVKDYLLNMHFTDEDIDYLKEEHIDATTVLVRSFKSQDDIIDGQKFNVGNMVKGFGFQLGDVHFNNSEAAYIAGLFSNNTPEHLNIQKQLQENDNGWKAKKEIREQNKRLGRRDWTECDPETGIPFNIEWMKWVVWQKCKTNADFAKLLRQVPLNAMIVEDSTGKYDPTAKIWGCHNTELWRRRRAKGEKYKGLHPAAKKKEIAEEELKMNNVGVWEGRNVMGKILKACSLCLIAGEELPINYPQLYDKNIFLMGRRLTFGLSILGRYTFSIRK